MTENYNSYLIQKCEIMAETRIVILEALPNIFRIKCLSNYYY